MWLTCAACLALSQAPPKGWNRFVSTVGGYAVNYPSSWRLLNPDLPTLEIVNFPSSQQVRAVILPRNGAMIAIVPAPGGIRSIEDWIKTDFEKTGKVSTSARTLQRTIASKQPLQVTEVSGQWGQDVQETGEDINDYFEISGRLFVARLSYWKGDPNAAQHREVLRTILESISTVGQPKP
jgi:hypothetical protein